MLPVIAAVVGSVGAAIGSALSTAGAFISGAAIKLGPIIANYASNFIANVAKIPAIDIETIKTMVDIACKIIHSICDFLGIESETDPAILGAKAEQADKTLSDYDNDTEAYIKYLKDEIEIDKEKFEKMSSEQKMGCKAVGIALEVKAVENRIGEVKIPPEYVATLAKIQMGSDLVIGSKDLVDIIFNLKSAGIHNMLEVTDYLEGKGDSDRIKTGEVLKVAVGKLAEAGDSEQYVEHMKQAARKFEEE